jgi:hypothetical protein
MTEQTRTIVFRSPSEKPVQPDDDSYPQAILYNQCDGYHMVFARFDVDGTFDGFYDFCGTDQYTEDFYSAWALMPDANSLFASFGKPPHP